VSLFVSHSARIIGIDLAWGNKNPDGLCLIHAHRDGSRFLGHDLRHSDNHLLDWISQHATVSEPTLLFIDAPLIVPNETGMRPADREVTRIFGQNDAGAFPANARLCKRPLRVAQRLGSAGYKIGHELTQSNLIAAEVYPHPATIRFFGIDKTIKYKAKKGRPKDFRRSEFKRLQDLILRCIERNFPDLQLSPMIASLLSKELTEGVEHQTDAVLCALIGYNHWLHRGRRSEIIGDTEAGFILLPTLFDQ
jgi:predicted RNase H-like nuclease